jgi:pimeloyl-ACP methyl ester carboxylesterase
MLAILTRPAHEANIEPFALTWESAFSLFAKTPIAYAITGVERVAPGQASTLSRLYETTLRLLGAPRLPLFHHRTGAAVAASVALTHPASALVTGDAHEETTELRHALGVALAGALPSHVLLLGLPEPQSRALWGALLAAFGPPDEARGIDKEASKLAEQLWTTVPPRAQRRLKELLAGSRASDFDLVLAAARQSARRVGLFVAGDFGFAARAYLAERKLEHESLSGEDLRVACAEHAPLADLLRLAVSPELAEARWHPVNPGPQRGSASSGRRALH